MYHRISGLQNGSKHPYYETATTPQVFAQHMKFLHDNGYGPIGLSEAVQCLEAPTRTPAKPVVITFDDGYQDFHTHAFPVLSRYGFSATVYLPTASIGETAQAFKGAECLSWGQVHELHKAGIHFGSHTVNHPQLKDLESKDVQYEVRCSKETIEDRLGCPVTSFAYPYAFPETNLPFRQRLRGFLEEAGYQNGVCTIIGTADRTGDRFFMKRLPMNSHDDLGFFRAKLAGAYDWVHTLQYASKLIATRR